ncbi:preprotein translocase/ SecG subunit [Synechococcus sp. A18-25c]|nr:preprotein translocase/ SecG subunit [Synechococcus sp. A15-60]QNJ19106.1 preprotein translocase/ SecG subunit [Synechococcus sp. A18-25c]
MGGLAASGSSSFTSASSAEATLNRFTWTTLAIFLTLAVILSAGWLS